MIQEPYARAPYQRFGESGMPVEPAPLEPGSYGGGGGLMGAPTSPRPATSVTPAPFPQGTAPPTTAVQPPVTTPAGPSTPVQPPHVTGGPAPISSTPVQPPPVTGGPAPISSTPVQGPAANWQDNIHRPPGQSAPPPPVLPSSPVLPPASQAINYAPTAPIGTNAFVPTGPNMLGTGSAGVGDYRGAFAEGDRGAATRTVQDNELSGYQLDQLIKGDSQYIQNANIASKAAAAEKGMLMSGVAVGAGRRASIDAAQPFAMQQADAYGRTASENMAASNADNLADQGQYRDMAARDIALRAQMEDASLGRQFQAGQASNEQAWRSGEAGLDRNLTQSESLANRNFQSGERAAGQTWQSGESAYDRAWKSDQSALERYQQTSERLGQQDYQSGETAYDRAWREYQADVDRARQTNERLATQDFNQSMATQEQQWRTSLQNDQLLDSATQADKQRAEARYGSYFNSVTNREAQTTTVLNAIYSNPNMTPQQQQQAADNARAVMASIYDGYNTVLSNGIPPIFQNPYPMTFPAQPVAQPTP